ncbi:MAG TPA: ATP synthase F1 subunit delta [Candidatus Limnocylindrales bacterium]|jgi:F-type H+-transporting ATPase subunit delta
MARPTTAARRYAEAAFEIAERDDSLDRWVEDLELAAGVAADERVARVFDDPSLAPEKRNEVLTRLFGKRLARPALSLVRLLARRSRLDLLPAVAAEFRRLVNRRRGIVEAVVTSAAALSDSETDAVRSRVESMTGASVQLRAEVDPDLIGGLTVRVGDQLLDASVRGRLERLRDQLVAGIR